jgi:hypothetical protein
MLPTRITPLAPTMGGEVDTMSAALASVATRSTDVSAVSAEQTEFDQAVGAATSVFAGELASGSCFARPSACAMAPRGSHRSEPVRFLASTGAV